MRKGYGRDDVQTHSDGFRDRRPAVNVKVYKDLRDAWDGFAREEQPDARFTLEWIDDTVPDTTLDAVFWNSCAWEFEYLESWATGADGDALFPVDRVQLHPEGRSGGWIAVSGLPDVDEWDAVRIARWRKFERIAREIADGIPAQMLSSLYLNEFEVWADEQEDASISNAEAPVDIALVAAAS